MTYSCDLDVIKPAFSAQSASRIYADISKEIALLWRKPNLFMSAEYALHSSLEDGDFVINNGIMIANTTIMQIDRPVHMLHRLVEKIDVAEAADDKAVNLIFTLISPENDGALHLRRLSRITRLFQDYDFCDHLRMLEDGETIRSHFMYSDLEKEKAA